MSRQNTVYTAKTLSTLLESCEETVQMLRDQRDRVVKNGLEGEGWSLAHTASVEHGLHSLKQMARELAAKIDLHIDIHRSITRNVSQRKRNPNKYRGDK